MRSFWNLRNRSIYTLWNLRNVISRLVNLLMIPLGADSSKAVATSLRRLDCAFGCVETSAYLVKTFSSYLFVCIWLLEVDRSADQARRLWLAGSAAACLVRKLGFPASGATRGSPTRR